jgi:hypothetical protein
MDHAGWKPLDSTAERPRYFDRVAEGWFRFAMVSPNFGTPVGRRKLMQLRSTDERARGDAAAKFARHVIDFLPAESVVAYMPSSTRRTARSDPHSVSSTVLSALTRDARAPQIVEPLIRAAPVPPVAETRVRNVRVLASTLEAVSDVRLPETLHVIDEMVATGATFAAFQSVLHGKWPHVRPVLLAWVR